MSNSDQSQTKIAAYVFLCALLVILLTPFAIIGTVTKPTPTVRAAPVPLVEPDVTPRETVTAVCADAVARRYPGAQLKDRDTWLLTRNEAGNYKMFVKFSAGNLHALRWCTVQPVNGAMQLVSLL